MKNLRIQNTPDDLKQKIKTLARDRGETMSDFMRPVIREISDKYKIETPINSELSTIILTGTSDIVIEELTRASKKIGVTVEQLLRLELFHFIENQSEFNKSLF